MASRRRPWLILLVMATAALAGCASGPQANADDPTGDGLGGTADERVVDTDGNSPTKNGTGVLRGNVSNEAGAPLAGAHIAVLGTQLFSQTDAQGRFVIADVPAGEQSVRVNREGYLGFEKRVTIADGKALVLDIVLVDQSNRGAGFVEHTHNLWPETGRIMLFDGTAGYYSGPLTGGSDTGSTYHCGGFGLNAGNCYVVPLELDPFQLVPPGTDRIEVTVRWDEEAPVREVFFHYQSAASSSWDAGTPVENGITTLVPVEPGVTDHGHQRWTLWQMKLMAYSHIAGVAATNEAWNHEMVGDFDVTVEIVKGDLPAEPPHRDFWKDGDTLLLTEDQETTVIGLPRTTRDPTVTSCGDTAICFTLPDGVVVPPGTTRLDVRLAYSANTPAVNPYLTQKVLTFRPADGPPAEATLETIRTDAPTEQTKGDVFWSLPVAPEETDAFYQKRSLWLFMLANEGYERERYFIEDCFHYVAGCGGSTYRLTVSAVNEDWTAS